MRIENLSIKAVTIIIFSMIGIVAIVLSILAGSYFKKAALNAQMNSLSRVIEVASYEMLRELNAYTFDLGMKMGHSRELIQATRHHKLENNREQISAILDDPFINGFVGFSNINLEKIRVYGLDLSLIAESQQGIEGLGKNLDDYLVKKMLQRKGIERLKAIDALWMSPHGPMHSTLVPVGGLYLIAYLEVIVNPAFNIPDIGKITKTPISVYSINGEPVSVSQIETKNDNYLPIQFTLNTSEGKPAYKIIGYEDVAKLDKEMGDTLVVTISGFLVLSLITLIFALWLFNRFLFVPLKRMMRDMEKMTHGRLDLTVNKKGLKEFYFLAQTFNLMANQVRQRTNELERLLDLDDSAIMCFGSDNEAVYFNSGASSLFAYSRDEIGDLDISDLFVEDINQLMRNSTETSGDSQRKLHEQLSCTSKSGEQFQCEAMINLIDTQDSSGYAIVLRPLINDQGGNTEDCSTSTEQSGQRMNAIEQSLSNLLEMAKTNPSLLSSLNNLEQGASENKDTGDNKLQIREQAVSVMLSALACWEHDISRSKLDLAEESKIWPVYIDKSTPTTRTLDKYLNIDSCPKNPRCQRVIDTAEFVLKQLEDHQTEYKQKLMDSLQVLRQLISGI